MATSFDFPVNDSLTVRCVVPFAVGGSDKQIENGILFICAFGLYVGGCEIAFMDGWKICEREDETLYLDAPKEKFVRKNGDKGWKFPAKIFRQDRQLLNQFTARLFKAVEEHVEKLENAEAPMAEDLG